MPRRERPSKTRRSEHWLRVAVNERKKYLNSKIALGFGWTSQESIQWLSPIKDDNYAEYYDQAFLDRLGLYNLRTPLKSFWLPSGPRWDGLAKTTSGKVILVEAKAHIEETVDYHSKASSESLDQINRSLSDTKKAFGAYTDARWESPFYQYANRLAHLYFLSELNSVDAYMLFLYFADAPDVPYPCTAEQWDGAIRLTKKCLGLSERQFQGRVGNVILKVSDMLSDQPAPK